MSYAEELVVKHTILAVVAGSRSFGLDTDASDTDRRGVYVAPTADFWRLAKPPTHVEGPLDEQFSWEVERFCALALAGNPNLLEVLHSPVVERCTELGEELRALGPAFLSRRVHRTFGRYADRQLARAESRRERDGGPKWKHVLHLLRLLLSAEHLLRTGGMDIGVGPYRERLLAVGRGETDWDDVLAWRGELVRGVDAALEHSPLPEEPDTARVEAWLMSVRRRGLE
ncbi:nucleotidyltransferase domain-containing protein [Streptomyces sp. NPDC051940]|uniref:nucleotidyltransferase domain-containing protein n=1 Tax=Streptomyces sp. NPDC051940 TaxID=3155675 RepID=UPI003424F73A